MMILIIIIITDADYRARAESGEILRLSEALAPNCNCLPDAFRGRARPQPAIPTCGMRSGRSSRERERESFVAGRKTKQPHFSFSQPTDLRPQRRD